MNKKECPVCRSKHTIKYGVRKGVQLYKCQYCGYQFRAGRDVSGDELWNAYQQEKQTIEELSKRFGKSVSTVKRRLHDIKREWEQPPLSGEGFVHLDTTYWGRSFGVLLALDNATGKPLYMAFVKSDPERIIMMTVKQLRDFRSTGTLVRPNEFDGNIIIEAWKYPPVTMIGTYTDCVDRLSLAVSLRDNYDARVQGELTRLIEQTL